MELFIGIDGGGTGCRAAVADMEGRVLGRAEAGPANIASDSDGAFQNIMNVVESALAAAVGISAVSTELPRLHAGLGLAGANAAGASAGLLGRLPFASARIETDAIAAVKGALQHGDGILAAIGTGSVFAIQRAGEIRQIGGWGLILGDEGSGASVGRALLRQILRAVDGFTAMTPLAASILHELGGTGGIVNMAKTARPVDFARLARQVVGSDDMMALSVMNQAEQDVAASIDLLQDGGASPVVFVGGLGTAYEARLTGRWPITPALGDAVDGALWLARQAT